jgi:hypothetical protein
VHVVPNLLLQVLAALVVCTVACAYGTAYPVRCINLTPVFSLPITPSFEPAAAAAGAGSFGRVYRGVWRELTVAVKVLQHDSTTAAAVANEVDLVMSFRCVY